jgi:3-dehydroquinate synthase class II
LKRELTTQRQLRRVSLSLRLQRPPPGEPGTGSTRCPKATAMKTKTITAADLAAFASLLEEKRTTAAAAAAAAKAAKVAAEALGLPAESVLLKADDKSLEVAAIYTVRPVAAIAEREDRFHSFKVVKG